ncbi:MAG: adenylyltransferase/cytidyltransferase family protein [Eubacterium sp.]
MGIKNKIKRLPIIKDIDKARTQKKIQLQKEQDYRNNIRLLLEVQKTLDENGIKLFVIEPPTLERLTRLTQNQIDRINSWTFNFNTISEKDTRLLKELYGEDYSPSYIQKIYDGTKVVVKNGIKSLCDFDGDLVTIKNGIRKTCYQPKDFSGKIHIYGACTARGTGVENKHTIESFLQIILNDNYKPYLVENNGIGCGSRFVDDIAAIKETAFCKGDIVIIFNTIGGNIAEFCKEKGINYCNTCNEMDNMECEWFTDLPQHTIKAGNKRLAEIIFEQIKDSLNNDSRREQEHFIFNEALSSTIEDERLLTYVNELKKICPKDAGEKRCGAIVMNCNPFTKGHRYLIETAAKAVDYLFIFVVEEDKSFFKFEDRINLVKLGTEDLDNVIVTPSGRFVLSALTFPGYFNKENDQQAVVDTGNDIKIFAKYIAPVLNIKVRFAGEEPLDNITNQYNETMGKLLPLYNIEFKEIKRAELGEEVISASRVRAAIKNKDWELISNLVPKTTLDFLKEKYFDEK